MTEQMLDKLPATDVITELPSHIVDAGSGPCTEQEARELITDAVNAATRFHEAMAEILRRRAWEPLGYDNPRSMLLGEFKGKLINPSTGKPYGKSHVYRMARVAAFIFEISNRTGVDPIDLEVDERVLRGIKGGQHGEEDLSLLDSIESRIREHPHQPGVSDADHVQQIVDEVLAETTSPTGQQTSLLDEDLDLDDDLDDLDDGDFDAVGQIDAVGDAGGLTSQIRPFRPGGVDDNPPGGGSVAAKSSAEGTSEDIVPTRAALPHVDELFDQPPSNGGLTMREAIADAQQYLDFTRALTDTIEVAKRIPTMAMVKDRLPQFVDNVDDMELAGFKELLVSAETALAKTSDAVEAIRATLQVVEDRQQSP